MLLMLITTSGDGVVGTWFSNVNSCDGVWIVDTSVASDDDSTSEGGSLLPYELTRRSRVF